MSAEASKSRGQIYLEILAESAVATAMQELEAWILDNPQFESPAFENLLENYRQACEAVEWINENAS